MEENTYELYVPQDIVTMLLFIWSHDLVAKPTGTVVIHEVKQD